MLQKQIFKKNHKIPKTKAALIHEIKNNEPQFFYKEYTQIFEQIESSHDLIHFKDYNKNVQTALNTIITD